MKNTSSCLQNEGVLGLTSVIRHHLHIYKKHQMKHQCQYYLVQILNIFVLEHSWLLEHSIYWDVPYLYQYILIAQPVFLMKSNICHCNVQHFHCSAVSNCHYPFTCARFEVLTEVLLQIHVCREMKCHWLHDFVCFRGQ